MIAIWGARTPATPRRVGFLGTASPGGERDGRVIEEPGEAKGTGGGEGPVEGVDAARIRSENEG